MLEPDKCISYLDQGLFEGEFLYKKTAKKSKVIKHYNFAHAGESLARTAYEVQTAESLNQIFHFAFINL